MHQKKHKIKAAKSMKGSRVEEPAAPPFSTELPLTRMNASMCIAQAHKVLCALPMRSIDTTFICAAENDHF
jgi:hypothetical protein